MKGLDGYDDPPNHFKNQYPDQYRQIAITVKYDFGRIRAFTKRIRGYRLLNIEELRDYCLQKSGVTEGFPFGEDTLFLKLAVRFFADQALRTRQSF